MSQIKLIKIDSNGDFSEMDTANDDVTLKSFNITGGGPVLDATGLNLANQPLSAVTNIVHADPTTNTINQTAGNLIIDNIMAKERSNVMTTAGKVRFPLITDTGAQVDSFKVPNIAGVPSATPAASAVAGDIVYDSTNKNMYVWDGAAWENMNNVTEAQNLDDTYVAAVALAARDVVYVSAADNVSKAKADAASTGHPVGFSTAAYASTNTATVRKMGRMAGFTALTSGSRYFLDKTTAGAITATPPTGAGAVVVEVGIAKNATTLDIRIMPSTIRS